MRVLCLGIVLLCPFVVATAKEIPDDVMQWARGVVKTRLADAPRAPEFARGREWLNVSRSLTLGKDLAGKVVVLDFWCYCCINCIHVLPDLEYLETKYAGQAFAVVGVHSAKFTNEKDTANIREAIRRYEIEHPVVNDGDFAIWKAYGARAWPTFAIVTPDGRLLGTLSGEGNREDIDALVAALLEHYGKIDGALDTSPLPVRLERSARLPGALAYPGKVAVHAARASLFVADSNHNRIVELGLDGRFRRAWGDGERGRVDGPPGTARFFRPQGMAVLGDALWVCDTENHAIRRIDLDSGSVTTVAGTGRQGNHARWLRMKDSHGPWPARETALNSPWDILFVNDTGYIAMAGSHSLWTIDPKKGTVSHFAGDTSERRLDADHLHKAAFAQPSGLTWDGKHLYVADSESSAIVRVGLDAGVVTIAGGSEDPKDLFHFGDADGAGRGRRFQHPLDVVFHEGVLYVADAYNDKIKTVDRSTGDVATRWGDGTEGASDDPPRFSEPGGLAVHGKTLYVADTNNHAIRTIDLATGRVGTLALDGVPIPQARAREGGAPATWPELPGTVFLPARGLRVGKAEGASFVFELELPDGWKLTPGAPSMLRVDIGTTVTLAGIGAVRNEVALPVLEAGAREGRLRVVYYVCQDAGTCRVRSVDMPLRVEVVADGPAAVVRDRFEP